MTASAADPPARLRADAEARAAFVRDGAGVAPSRLFETGGLRWRFPRSIDPCEAILINTGGGVAGGDSYRIALALEDGAAVEATTPAAERVYRSDGPPARVATALALAPRARLLWAPQETILFDGAALDRSLAIDMAVDAELIVAETLIFGRLAMGEGRIEARLRDSWRLRRAGRLAFADVTHLARGGMSLDRPTCGAGARAVATLLAAAPNIEARLPAVRATLEAAAAEIEAGASAFDGILFARLLSADPGRLRETVIAAMMALTGRAPSRLWR